MKNSSVADFVSATMDKIVKSAEHKALFGTQYKYAQDMNDAKKKCSKCDQEECMCDSAMVDDNFAKKCKCPGKCTCSKKEDSDSSSADDNDAKKKWNFEKKEKSSDSSDADDNDARKHKKEESSEDSSSANDGLEVATAFDIAIDSLLTASAALDTIGFDKSATISLKLASFITEAKKKICRKTRKKKRLPKKKLKKRL